MNSADAVPFLAYIFCFIGATISDLKTLEIPNRIPGFLLLIGAIKIVLKPDTLLQAVIGLVGIGLLLLLPDLIVEGIGGGDIKLCAAAAFVIGFERSLIALILSFIPAILYGLLVRKGRGGFALAPFFLVGFFVGYLI